MEARAVSLVGDMRLELEQRGLCFIRNTQKYMQHGMPWVKEVLLRLPEALQGQDLVDAMSFVSFIGILQNGDYISFDKLRALLEDLPLSQSFCCHGCMASNSGPYMRPYHTRYASQLLVHQQRVVCQRESCLSRWQRRVQRMTLEVRWRM